MEKRDGLSINEETFCPAELTDKALKEKVKTQILEGKRDLVFTFGNRGGVYTAGQFRSMRDSYATKAVGLDILDKIVKIISHADTITLENPRTTRMLRRI